MHAPHVHVCVCLCVCVDIQATCIDYIYSIYLNAHVVHTFCIHVLISFAQISVYFIWYKM